MYVGKNTIENVFYVDMDEKYTKTYIQSEEFVNELNEYIENYQTDDEIVLLKSWKYNEGDFPTLELN